MTAEQRNEINRGIIFEEEFIRIIGRDIQETGRFNKLPVEKRNAVIERLKVMVEDSKRHLMILEDIIEKY